MVPKEKITFLEKTTVPSSTVPEFGVLEVPSFFVFFFEMFIQRQFFFFFFFFFIFLYNGIFFFFFFFFFLWHIDILIFNATDE